MYIVKKHFPVVMLVLGLILMGCSILPASNETSWNIKWNSNGSLDEKVIITNHRVVINDQQWETSYVGNQIILSRHIKNWQAYGQIGDSLPFTVIEKNYLLIKFVNLTLKPEATSGSLFEQFAGFKGASLNIEVPGIIHNSTAESSQNSIAVWNLASLYSSPIKLDVVVFDGILLSVFIFATCFIIIFIIYLNRIRKVNRLIVEEYSLERAAQEFIQTKNQNQKEKS